MKQQRVISYRAGTGFNKVPFIRLSGIWLKSIGFEIGSKYQLTTDKSTIILKPIGKEVINDTDTCNGL